MTASRPPSDPPPLPLPDDPYSRLVHHAREGMVVIQEGRVVFANPMAGRLTGFRPAELRTMAPLERVLPEDAPRANAALEGAAKGRRVRRALALRILDRRGRVRWLEAWACAGDWNQRPAVLCFFADITDREQSSRRAARAEREQAALLRGLTNVAVEYIDQDMRIVWANACSLAQAGLEPAQALGRTEGAHKIIGLAIQEQDCRVVLSIRDNGPGMSEAVLRQASRKGFSTRESGKGLGLHIVERLCREIGAEFSLQSREGDGTAAEVRLPRGDAAPAVNRG